MKNRGLRPIIIAVLCIVLAMTVGTVIYKQAFAGKGNTASVNKQSEEAKVSAQPSEEDKMQQASKETASPGIESPQETQEVSVSATPEASKGPDASATPAASKGPEATGVVESQAPAASASATNATATSQPNESNQQTSSKPSKATAGPTKHPGQSTTNTPATKSTPTPQATKKPTTNPTKKPTAAATKKPQATEPQKTETPQVPTITFTIDASVIGNGTYAKNVKVELVEGETAAATITRGLKEEGFGWSNTGSVNSMFYLQSISKTNLVKDPVVPERVQNILEDNGVKLRITKYKSGSLGEFDFTKYSGWRYSVNGTYASVGMSEYELKAGDHVLLKYTLCLGYDA